MPISWRLAPPEIRYQLEDAEPALFLVEDEYRELAEATRLARSSGRRAAPAAGAVASMSTSPTTTASC